MPNSEQEKVQALARIWFVNHGHADWPKDFKVWIEMLCDLRAEARRAAIEECAQIAERMDTTETETAYDVAIALRSKLAAPEKEETNVPSL